jgi:1-acyl-sn-glycerol-3-phosphate acyltransferase
VKRRLEVRAEVNGVTIIDDFAHHPTAIRETLRALRTAYAGRRLWAVLEPRSNTLRRNVFERRWWRAWRWPTVPERTACVFMSNHISNLDPPALIPRIPGRTSAFFKRSLVKIPVLGYGMKLGEFVPVDRDGRVESAVESVAAARRVLEKGIHITTFVEGTRSSDGRLLPFKKGPFYLAMEAGAPVVPVSIFGTETMMAKGSLRVNPGTAHIVFHEPLNPSEFAGRDALMSAVRESIASGLPEWMRG